MWHPVTTADELLAALDAGQRHIEVRGTLSGTPMITLPPGVALRGGTLEFGAKGLRLTRDNSVEYTTVLTAEHEAAISNDTAVEDFGTLSLRHVETRGQVVLLADAATAAGHVHVDGLHVLAADLRGRLERPRGIGVEILPGGFMLWNRQADPDAVLTAELNDVRVGTSQRPVRGSGIFVGGRADGGAVRVSTLCAGETHTDGGIPVGTPDLISGGVSIGAGGIVGDVVTAGSVTTNGAGDMVLDNMGEVTTWTAYGPLTSHGASGVGFVNFGALDRLDVRAPLHTFGAGARGFNFYAGSLRHASFDAIATHGDGAIGVQVTRPLRVLEIAGDLATDGGFGRGLVKGVQVMLAAVPLSVGQGGVIDSVSVGGQVRSTGDDVPAIEIEGVIGRLSVAGGVVASGRGADGIHTSGDPADYAELAVTVADGRRVVRPG